MIRSRWILISSLALTACGGDDGEAAGPSYGTGGSSGESGAGGGWGNAGDSGSAGEAGSESGGAAGGAGSSGEAGAAGADADAGVDGDAGEAGAAGSGAEGGSGGAGGSGGSAGGFTSTGGTGGSGGSGGSVTLATFITNLTKNGLTVFCPGGSGTLVGSYTASYKNVLYSKATAAAVTKSHVFLSKSGKPTMSYTFTVTPASSALLDQGESATVAHAHKFASGVGTADPCLYCGGTMTLDVEWILSNGETRKDSFGPVAVACSSP